MAFIYQVELLGGLTVRLPGRAITRLHTQKTASLLAYLAVHLERTHSREELADRFWPDADREGGRMSLRTCLSALRRELEDDAADDDALILADRHFIRLNAARVTTDVRQFQEEMRRAARAEKASEKIAPLQAAVALYHGPLLPGFYEDWAIAERERFQLLYVQALRELTAALTTEGRWDEAAEYALRAVQTEPLDERSHTDLMRLYSRMGKLAALTRQYRDMERRLRDELDSAPSAATQALYRQLTREAQNAALPSPEPTSGGTASETGQAAAVSVAETPSEGETATTPSPVARLPLPPLPAPLTRFFGRQEELRRLEELLQAEGSARLVTLTGPGGNGKTRLALEVGHRLAAHGVPVVFVPLVEVTRADLLPGAILQALHLPQEASGDTRDQLQRVVAPFSGVLILDNFEQVAAEGAGLVQGLLEAAPGLRCLVTSRIHLDIGGEQEFPVPTLPVPFLTGLAEPAEGTPSVQLFLDRARAARPDFAITRENAAAVSAICERLDGIPLALELAAAWVQTLTPAQILARLSDRFQLLTSRRKDLPARHRTLRSAIEWSFQTLEPTQQQFCARLSVFRGGWTLEAAEAVCEEPEALSLLAVLQERALILSAASGAEMCYRMLETLREYGREQLSPDESAALRERHAQYFQEYARRHFERVQSPEQARALEALEAEQDNLRAALDWATSTPGSGATTLALQVCACLFRYWGIRGRHAEGRRWLNLALSRDTAGVPVKVLSEGLYFAGVFALDFHDHAEAERLLREAMRLMEESGDRYGVVNSINRLGLVRHGQGDFAAAERLFRGGLARARAEGFLSSEVNLLKCLGGTLRNTGRWDEAKVLLEEGLARSRDLGDPSGISMMLGENGHLRMAMGDEEYAEGYFLQQLEMARELRSVVHRADALRSLLLIAAHRGDWEQAHAFCAESRTLANNLIYPTEGAYLGLVEAGIALRRNHADEAEQTLRDTLSLVSEIGDPSLIGVSLRCAAMVATYRGDPARAARLWQAAESRSAPTELPSPLPTVYDFASLPDTLLETLGPEAFVRETDAGKHLPLADALMLAG